MMFNTYILKTIYFYFLLFTVCSCTSKNEKSNVNITNLVTQEDSSSKIKNTPINFNEIPLDTINCDYADSAKLYVLIYEYHDSVDKQKIKSFEIKTQDNISILRNNGTILKRLYDGPWDDWYQITPVFKIINKHPFKMELNFIVTNSPNKNTELNIKDYISELLINKDFFSKFDDVVIEQDNEKLIHKFLTYEMVNDTTKRDFVLIKKINFSYPVRNQKDLMKIEDLNRRLAKNNYQTADSSLYLLKELFFLNLNGHNQLNHKILNGELNSPSNQFYSPLIYYYLSFLNE